MAFDLGITHRFLNYFYLSFFLVHIPVMFMVDLVALYPQDWTPTILLDLRQWYINAYSDQFFVSPPPFFRFFMWMEALFHVPASFWAVRALRRDDPRVPLVLLVYSVQTAVTTATCIADYCTWDISFNAKMKLMALYVPYLSLSILMFLDMINRISGIQRRASAMSDTVRSLHDSLKEDASSLSTLPPQTSLTSQPSRNSLRSRDTMHTYHDDDDEPPLHEEADTRIKIVLFSRDYSDFKLKIRPTTKISKMIRAFKVERQVPRDSRVGIYFNGAKLEPDSTAVSARLQDWDRLEVRVR